MLAFVKREVKWLQRRKKNFENKISKSLEAVVHSCSTDKIFLKS